MKNFVISKTAVLHDPRHSDHRLLLIDTGTGAEEIRSGGGGGYRFEAAWIEDEECKTVVRQAWEAAKQRGRSTGL